MLDPIEKDDVVIVKRADEDIVELHTKLRNETRKIHHLQTDIETSEDEGEILALKVSLDKLKSEHDVNRAIFWKTVKERYNLWAKDIGIKQGYAVCVVVDKPNGHFFEHLRKQFGLDA